MKQKTKDEFFISKQRVRGLSLLFVVPTSSRKLFEQSRTGDRDRRYELAYLILDNTTGTIIKNRLGAAPATFSYFK